MKVEPSTQRFRHTPTGLRPADVQQTGRVTRNSLHEGANPNAHTRCSRLTPKHVNPLWFVRVDL